MSAWYADFFTELPNAFWRAAVPPSLTTAEVDFVIRMCGLGPGSRVLDVPCGSGRHTMELARRGCQVTGLDVSAEAVEHARTATAAEGLRVDLRVGDMRTLPTDIRVDAAVCMGNAFGYLDHAGTRKFLADLAGLVVPGGALVLDYGFVAEALLPQLELEEPPMTFGGIEAVSVNDYDTANSRWITAFTFRRGDEEHRGTSVQHVYTAAEVTPPGHRGRLHQGRAVRGHRRHPVPSRQPATTPGGSTALMPGSGTAKTSWRKGCGRSVRTWTRLFGRFELGLDGVVAPGSVRAGSLLAYLLLHQDAPRPREHVAALFWPESTAGQARTNLRHLLHTVRVTVPDRYLEITPRTVRWCADDVMSLDVTEFERLLDGDGTDRHAAVRAAVALYRGDLLEGYTDEWVLAERDRLRRRYLDALAELARLGGEREPAQAISAAQRLVREDPLREEGYRLLMRLHAAQGDRARALAVYHDCSSTLERELGVPPSARTLSVYANLLPRGTVSDAVADRVALVGREPERAGLAAAWRSAEARHAQLVLVSGEPGVGKTRLVEELRAWCARRGAVVADARCYGAEGTLAYGPVADWLRSPALRSRLPRLRPDRLSEISRLLPELGDVPRPDRLPEAEQRRRVFDAVAAVVLDQASPVLLMVDDVHHADAETCGFLHYVLRAEPRARLLIVATARREEIGDALRRLLVDLRARQRLVELELAPFELAETTLLAERLLGRAPTTTDAHRLHEETEGNPLFVVEAIRAGWPAETATSPHVRAVIEARLARLRGPARELVEIAALVGREFDAAVLAGASTLGEDTLVASLDELWQRRIVRERAGGYDFSHDKIREVAAAAISPAKRRLLHRRIAAALEAADDPTALGSRIATHHEAAGAAGQAASWYRRAAEEAQLRIGSGHAVTLFERSLAQLRGLPASAERDAEELAVRTAQLAAQAAAQGYASPSLVTNQRRARELCAILGRDPTPALLRSLAMTASATADFAAAMRIGHQLLAAAERDGDDVLLVEAAFVLGITAFWEADFTTARRYLELAVERYRPEDRRVHLLRFGNDPKVSCLSRLGNTLWFLGEPAAAHAARDAALGWAEQIGHGYSLGIALWFGALLALDMDDEDRLRADTAKLATTSDSVQLQLAANALRGCLAVRDGQVSGIAAVRATIDRARGQEAPGLLASLHRILLAAYVTAGDAPGALAVAERLLGMGAGARVWEAEARRVLAAFPTSMG